MQSSSAVDDPIVRFIAHGRFGVTVRVERIRFDDRFLERIREPVSIEPKDVLTRLGVTIALVVPVAVALLLAVLLAVRSLVVAFLAVTVFLVVGATGASVTDSSMVVTRSVSVTSTSNGAFVAGAVEASSGTTRSSPLTVAVALSSSYACGSLWGGLGQVAGRLDVAGVGLGGRFSV